MNQTLPNTHGRRVALFLRFAGAAALLILVFRVFADFNTTMRLLASASVGWLLIGLCLAVSSEVITAYKWRLLAGHIGSNLPMGPAVRIALIGMFYNNLLPGSVGGDVARLLLAARYLGGRARAAASVFMQRNSGLGGLLLVGNLASWICHANVAHGSSPLLWPWVWFGLITLGYLGANLVLLSSSAYAFLWRLSQRFRVPHRFLALAAAKVKRLHQELLLYATYWTMPLLISVVTQLIDCTIVYVAARALGLFPSYHLFLISVPLVSVAALMPVTFNGIGLREIGYILLFSAAGISREAAAGIALLQFGYIAVLSAVGAVLVLMKTDAAPTVSPGRSPGDSTALDR